MYGIFGGPYYNPGTFLGYTQTERDAKNILRDEGYWYSRAEGMFINSKTDFRGRWARIKKISPMKNNLNLLRWKEI